MFSMSPIIADEVSSIEKGNKASATTKVINEPLSSTWILISIVAGGVVTLLVSVKLKSQMKSVDFKREANSYAVDDSLNITWQSDKFIRKYTTKKLLKKNNS